MMTHVRADLKTNQPAIDLRLLSVRVCGNCKFWMAGLLQPVRRSDSGDSVLGGCSNAGKRKGKMKTTPKTYTQSERLQLIGLLSVARQQFRKLEDMRAAIAEMLGEKDDLGHVADAIYVRDTDPVTEVDDLIRIYGAVSLKGTQ